MHNVLFHNKLSVRPAVAVVALPAATAPWAIDGDGDGIDDACDTVATSVTASSALKTWYR